MKRQLLALALLLALPARVGAWEADVHRGLTEWLALQAGFEPDAARAIATGDNHADDGIFDARYQVFWYACLGSEPTSSELVREMHFPTFAPVGLPPALRTVQAGGPAAGYWTETLLDAPKPRTSDETRYTLQKVGEALHRLQDSWSHQGEPDNPGPCDAGLVWAHPKARGGWRSHSADHTSYGDVAVPLGAAQRTYEFLVKFRAATAGTSSGSEPKAWSQLEPAVVDFAQAATKEAKASWFTKHGFTDPADLRAFLAGITLEDAALATAPPPAFLQANVGNGLSAFARYPRPSSSMPGNPMGTVPPDVLAFFRSFWGNWVGSANVTQVVNTYLAADLMRKPQGFTGDPRRRAEDLLTMWRVRDHGAVSRVGHSPPLPGTKAAADLANLLKQPRAMLPSRELADAMIALGTNGPPIVVLPDKSGRYAAIGRFRHAPYDAVMAIAAQVQGNWRVVEITSAADH